MRSYLVSLLLCSIGGIFALGLLAGCETTSSSPLDETTYGEVPITERYPELQYRESMKLLRTGMTQAEVTALISDPIRTIAATADRGSIERWIYELQHRPQFRTITTDMEEIPTVDPITGQAGVILQPREETERFQLTEIFTLGFDADGFLVDLDYTSQRRRN